MKRVSACLLALAAAAAAVAQQSQTPIRLTVRPAAEPVPALKYQLLPPQLEQTPGNAAVLYYRAFNPEWFSSFQGKNPDFFREKVDRWLRLPLKDLPRAELAWSRADPILREVDRAARREFCDWELSERTKAEGISLLLPELQSFRQVGQLLALRCRLEVAEGKFDRAVHTLQTGYALARHVADGPSLIHTLVAVAIATSMTDRLEELLQAPGAPNFYWALTALPRPFLTMQKALLAEMTTVPNLFPELRDIEAGPLSPGQMQSLQGKVASVLIEGDLTPVERGHGPWSPARLKLTGLVMALYPEARRSLIAQGRKPETVAALPAFQVVILFSYQQYRRLQDDLFKWTYLPYWEARRGMEQALKNATAANDPRREGLPFAKALLPAMAKVYFTPTRIDRRLAALRCVEAVRLHAAAHDGRLPASLEDVKIVPVPIDPVTGKGFVYKADGTTATLEGPALPGETPGPHNRLVIEIGLQR